MGKGKSVELGATGKFPKGKLGPNDEGEIRMGVGVDEKSNTVIVEFGTPVTWLGLPKMQALALGNHLITQANKLKD